jgi:AraC-like DNA-binding protein
VLRGTCWLLRAGADPLWLSAGDIVLLPREFGHALADHPDRPLTDFRASRKPGVDLAGDSPSAIAPGAGEAVTELLCGAYVLDRSRPHPLLADLPDVIHLPARVGHHPRLRAAVDLLGGELAEPRVGATASISALLDLLLLYMLRAWFSEQSTGWSAALADPAISAALQAMHTSPHAPWTVRDLGAAAGLSRTVFAQRFTALVGRSPMSYLTWWRMPIAAKLLRETDLPLSAVAARCDYSSEFAFAKTFRRKMGLPPGQFRRQTEAEITETARALS